MSEHAVEFSLFADEVLVDLLAGPAELCGVLTDDLRVRTRLNGSGPDRFAVTFQQQQPEADGGQPPIDGRGIRPGQDAGTKALGEMQRVDRDEAGLVAVAEIVVEPLECLHDAVEELHVGSNRERARVFGDCQRAVSIGE